MAVRLEDASRSHGRLMSVAWAVWRSEGIGKEGFEEGAGLGEFAEIDFVGEFGGEMDPDDGGLGETGGIGGEIGGRIFPRGVGPRPVAGRKRRALMRMRPSFVESTGFTGIP